MTYLRYKNYIGTIEPELEQEYKNSVDEYLISCYELGREPNKPCRGSFNVCTGESLHRAAVIAAEEKSLNAFVCDAIREKIERVHPELVTR